MKNQSKQMLEAIVTRAINIMSNQHAYTAEQSNKIALDLLDRVCDVWEMENEKP